MARGVEFELGINRTWYEKFMDFLVPVPCAAEERALYAQEIRRLKIKTDLQEARIKRMLERQKEKEEQEGKNEKDFRTVATWTPSFQHKRYSDPKYIPVTGQVFLQVNKNTSTRRLQVGGVVGPEQRVILDVMTDQIWAFLKTQPDYLRFIQPWVEWQIDLDDVDSGCHELIVPKKRSK